MKRPLVYYGERRDVMQNRDRCLIIYDTQHETTADNNGTYLLSRGSPESPTENKKGIMKVSNNNKPKRGGKKERNTTQQQKRRRNNNFTWTIWINTFCLRCPSRQRSLLKKANAPEKNKKQFNIFVWRAAGASESDVDSAYLAPSSISFS